MHIDGKLFASGRAQSSAAAFIVFGEQYHIQIGSQKLSNGLLKDVQVSDRLGSLERKLQLADGSVFATSDNDAVDQVFSEVIKRNSLVNRLESSWRWVAVALVLSVGTSVAFFRWGLPWVSHTVAHMLPQETGEVIGKNTLEFLDDYIFEPSLLDPSERNAIRRHFESTLLPGHQENTEINYALHFRAWGEGDDAIPNALALPSGDIILTDRFVELAANQNEIDAVLLHEMGHIEYRHSLEMLAQSTLVAVILAMFIGDASGVGDMGIGLGSLLVTTGYSRKFESEADKFAFEHMLKAGIDPTAFADIMAKITSAEFDGKTQDQDEEDETGGWTDYLSTHPNTQERIAQAKRYAQCFRKGYLVCDAAILEAK